MPRLFAPSPLAGEGQDGGRSGSPLRINDNGDLILHAESGEIYLHKPRIYQEINGVKQPISGSYVLLELETQNSELETQQVGFQVAAYDTSKPLIIDPVLSYSTYLGGSSDDFGWGIAVDSSGNAYVTGSTFSTNFPTTPGALQPANSGSADVFVAKLNSTGSALVYSTYLGGNGYDFGVGIAVDTSGNAYVTGPTSSTNFPIANPLQAAFGGGSFHGDVFVAKLNPTGSALVYSTYLGGSSVDFGIGIAVDASGNAYVTGFTGSPNFPTASPLQAALGGFDDAFVAKVDLAVSTPVGTNIIVQPIDAVMGTTPVTLTFSNVTQAGTTSLTTSSSGPTPPSGFKLGSPETYYELTTTAVFSSVTVCIDYAGVSFTGQEKNLKLFHFDTTTNKWVNVTASVDTATKTICSTSLTSLSPFAIFEPAEITVTIDIKPGSDPNSINLGSGGTVPVAIFSTTTFNALTVDSTSVTLASAPVNLKGKGTPMASFEDVDGNGFLDLVVHVTTEALQLSETDTEATLEGKTFDGTLIRGVDTVRVVP